jgi:Na+/H+-dicarboxylate symporter
MVRRLTSIIIAAALLGLAAGYAANCQLGIGTSAAIELASYFHLLADVFLHLIKMIIAPLVFAALVTGIANLGDRTTLGRIGGRALLWFFMASLISLGLGLFFVNLLQPGAGMHLVATRGSSTIEAKPLNPRAFILHVFPTSMIDAMATNDVLQVVVISLFVGAGLSAIGDKGKVIIVLLEALAEVMLRVTAYVMRVAPLAVFGAIASVVTLRGTGVLSTFGRLIGDYYIAVASIWTILAISGFLVLGRQLFALLRHVREPLLIAFTTASSEAAYPTLLERLSSFGVPRRISGLVLPLGYSFNLDGSMIYTSFATLFIAQAYDIELSLGTQFTMLLVLMVTSKGTAAVPRASLVVVAATLSQFGLPGEGVALVLAVDQFMDMGRTATNVLGNAVATAVLANWEDRHAVSADPPPNAAGNIQMSQLDLPVCANNGASSADFETRT